MIFRQGDAGNYMFLVAAGQVRVAVGEGEQRTEVALLGPGEFFGEMSLLEEAPRNATAEAAEDTVLLAIGRDVFRLMVQDDVNIVFHMMQVQSQRLRQAVRPIEILFARLGRLRVGLEALRRLTAPPGGFPASLEVPGIAAAVGLSPDAVRQGVALLAQTGAGVLEDGRWQFPARRDLERLIDALQAESDASTVE